MAQPVEAPRPGPGALGPPPPRPDGPAAAQALEAGYDSGSDAGSAGGGGGGGSDGGDSLAEAEEDRRAFGIHQALPLEPGEAEEDDGEAAAVYAYLRQVR